MEKIKKNKYLIGLFVLLYILIVVLCFITNNFDLKVLRGDILINLFVLLLIIVLFIMLKKPGMRILLGTVFLILIFINSGVVKDIYFDSKDIDIKEISSVKKLSNIIDLSASNVEDLDGSWKIYRNGFELVDGKKYYVKIYENAKWVAIISEFNPDMVGVIK